MITTAINLYLREADLVTAIAALEAAGEARLAGKLATILRRAREADAEHTAAMEAEAAERAKRAVHHILTPRQAMSLAATRAKHGPYLYWQEGGLWHGWRRGRSTGGAVRRMVQTLVDEGLLSDPTGLAKLTPAGLARLEAWEAEHGRIGGT